MAWYTMFYFCYEIILKNMYRVDAYMPYYDNLTLN